MSATFAPTTVTTLMPILSIPLTKSNTAIIANILSGIEAINSGAFVDGVETLISQILAIQATALSPAGLAQAGMIRADVVEWRGGANAGAISHYKMLISKLYVLVGLRNPDSGGVSMYRSDRYSLTSGAGYSIYDDWRLIAW